MKIKKYQYAPGPISRATDEYYNGTGWHFVLGTQLKQSDPNYSVARRKGLDKLYLVDKNGILVPESTRSAYEQNKEYQAQLPYQEQNDNNDARLMEIRQGDRDVRNRSMTQLNKTEMNNLANLSLTIGGTALAVPAFIAAPVATVGAFAGGMAGDWLGDKATKYFSNGKYGTWGDAVQDWTNGYIRADNGQLTNPVAWLGGAYGVRLGTGQVFRNAAYNQVTPLSYTSDKSWGINKPKEFALAIRDYLNPFFKLNSNKTPRWRKRLEKRHNLYDDYIKYDLKKGSAFEFRDQAWRKAMRIPEKEGTLSIYTDNGDGTFSYDFDNINAIRQKYNSLQLDGMPKFVTANDPLALGGQTVVYTPHIQSGESFIGFDHITTNGGFGKYTRNNDGTFTFEDVWDLQPFKDKDRRLMPVPRFLRNIEVVKFFGGNPFTVKTKIPVTLKIIQ